MSFPKNIRELCTPSKVYFGISLFVFFVMILQNLGNTKNYHLGCYSCYTSSLFLIFAFKLMYILFWTWVLNLICRDGYKNIAWFLVILPILLLFIIMGIFILM